MEAPMCWTDRTRAIELRFGRRAGAKLKQWKETMKALENKSEAVTTLYPSSLAAFATVALTLAFTLFVGTGSVEAGVGGDFAVGGFTLADGHIAFAAQQNAKGAGGYVVQDSMGVNRSGPVTCFTVDGNRATVEWLVKHSDNPSEVTSQQHRTFEVSDNGEPMMGMPTDQFLDRMQYCNDCGKMNGGGVMPVHGNAVVRDQ
jgi:hypothetical protein